MEKHIGGPYRFHLRSCDVYPHPHYYPACASLLLPTQHVSTPGIPDHHYPFRRAQSGPPPRRLTPLHLPTGEVVIAACARSPPLGCRLRPPGGASCIPTVVPRSVPQKPPHPEVPQVVNIAIVVAERRPLRKREEAAVKHIHNHHTPAEFTHAEATMVVPAS